MVVGRIGVWWWYPTLPTTLPYSGAPQSTEGVKILILIFCWVDLKVKMTILGVVVEIFVDIFVG